MGDFPVSPGIFSGETSLPSGNYYGVTVTASASVDTFGSWTELIASTSKKADGLLIFIRSTATPPFKAVLQIGIGTTVLVDKILIQPNGNQAATFFLSLPLFVPIAIAAGSQIQARLSSSVASETVSCAVMLVRGGFANSQYSGTKVYGFASGGDSTVATEVDPGATINTKGSYAELVASTAKPIRYMILMVSSRDVSANIAVRWRIDVAVGANGSERIIVPDVIFDMRAYNPAGQYLQADSGRFLGLPCSIPAGSRLAVRAQADNNTAGYRKLDVAILGVY